MPRFTYLGNQNFIIAKQSVRKTKLGLLAAGSGLTPIYQIVNAMHLAKDKTVEVKMIYSNKSEEDILMKHQLDTINGECENIEIKHCFSRQVDVPTWARKGRITWEMIQEMGFAEPSAETLICYCGPSGFNQLVKALFKEHGYDESMMFIF